LNRKSRAGNWSTVDINNSKEVGKINISEATYELVKGKYNCFPRGEINVKGKGSLKMYFIE